MTEISRGLVYLILALLPIGLSSGHYIVVLLTDIITVIINVSLYLKSTFLLSKQVQTSIFSRHLFLFCFVLVGFCSLLLIQNVVNLEKNTKTKQVKKLCLLN